MHCATGYCSRLHLQINTHTLDIPFFFFFLFKLHFILFKLQKRQLPVEVARASRQALAELGRSQTCAVCLISRRSCHSRPTHRPTDDTAGQAPLSLQDGGPPGFDPKLDGEASDRRRPGKSAEGSRYGTTCHTERLFGSYDKRPSGYEEIPAIVTGRSSSHVTAVVSGLGNRYKATVINQERKENPKVLPLAPACSPTAICLAIATPIGEVEVLYFHGERWDNTFVCLKATQQFHIVSTHTDIYIWVWQ